MAMCAALEVNMEKVWAALLGSLLIGLPGQVIAQEQKAFFVSPTGSDSRDGLSPDTAFATPERAEAEIAKAGSGTVYLMGGVYNRTSTLMFPHGPASQKWVAYQGQVPVFDGRGQVADAIHISADHVTVDGLLIRNFVNNGIVVTDSRNTTLVRNNIQNIKSTKWSQAGILVLGNSPFNMAVSNTISNTGYAGIEFFAPQGGDLSKTVIANNVVSNTCQEKEDCGAIYINGRSNTSDGSVISKNRIRDYGGAVDKSFGIYLDDFASNMTVSGNDISGSGSNPIIIHGGYGNSITGNVIGLQAGQKALYYAGAMGSRFSDMSGNRFFRNTVHGARGNSDLVKMGAPGKVAPNLSNNRMSQ